MVFIKDTFLTYLAYIALTFNTLVAFWSHGTRELVLAYYEFSWVFLSCLIYNFLFWPSSKIKVIHVYIHLLCCILFKITFWINE